MDGWWATAALAMATSRTAAHASFSKAWLLWPLRSAVLNQNIQFMVLDGELLCANSGWSYALVYDAFDRHVLLKKVTRFNPV